MSGATCSLPSQLTAQEELAKFTARALSKTLSRALPIKTLGFLREDLVTAQRRDPAATSAPEIALTYPGVHAPWTYRVSHALRTHGAHTPARAPSSIARAVTGMDIHPEATIGRRVFTDHATGVIIGQTAEVGNDVVIFHGVTLGGVAMTPGKRHPTVSDHVMTGAGAKVLGSIIVDTGIKIGANAVVVKDMPCGNVAIGVPARLLPKPEKDTRDRDLIVDPNCLFEEPAPYI